MPNATFKAFLAIITFFLFLGSAFAIPINEMNQNEKKDFNLLPLIQTPEISKIKVLQTTQVSQTQIPMIIESTDMNALNQIIGKNGHVQSLIGGKAFSVSISPDAARAFVQNQEIKHFSILRAKPLLNISNPSINTATFYDNGFSGAGAAICINDTGIRETHNAFSGKNFYDINDTACFANNNDGYGHGTHVAGITASTNSTYKGIAYGATNILNARGFDNSGKSTDCLITNVEDCFSTDLANPADVENNSWGAPNSKCDVNGDAADGKSIYTTYVDYVINFYHKNIIFAAGNDGPQGTIPCEDTNSLNTPSDAYNAITVAALDDKGTTNRADDTVSTYSSRGPTFDGRKKPDLSAPGNNIKSAYIGSNADYQYLSGTSMAAPHVTGAAALVIKAFNLNWLQTKALLINSAQDINQTGWDKYTGWGYIDLNKAFYEGNNTIFDSIDKNTYKNYALTLNSGDKVSVAWDRLCEDSYTCYPITNLFLYLYDENDSLIMDSNSLIDNVQQVTAPTNGNYRIQVESQDSPFANGLTNENYALSFATTPQIYNTKINSAIASTATPDFNELFYIDVNAENTTNKTQDFNILFFDGNTQIGTINSFTLGAFLNTVIHLPVRFTSLGEHAITSQLSTPIFDSNLLDNNKTLSVNVTPKINAVLISANIPDIFPYPDQNIQLAGREFRIDANIKNASTDNNAYDFNVQVIINNQLENFNVLRCNPGDYNFTTFYETLPTGDYNILINIAQLAGETYILDNNQSQNIRVDGNAIRISYVNYPASAAKDSNKEIDVNIINYGPAIDTNIFLINTATGEIKNSSQLAINADSNTAIVLYTQGLLAAGMVPFRISIPPLENETILFDNNSDFNIQVNAPQTNNNQVTASSSTGSLPIEKMSVAEESNETMITYKNDGNTFIPQEVSALLTQKESNTAINAKIISTITRSVITTSAHNLQGTKTMKTKVVLLIHLTTPNVSQISIVETIPKSIAKDANQIQSSTPFSVIKKDPIIKFTSAPDQNITYYVNDSIENADANSFNIPEIIAITLQPQKPVAPKADTNKITPLDTNTKQNSSLVSNSNTNIYFPFIAGSLIIATAVICVVKIILKRRNNAAKHRQKANYRKIRKKITK